MKRRLFMNAGQAKQQYDNQVSKSQYFKIIEIKNCRKYIKRCYTINEIINYELLGRLEAFGVLEIQYLSKFHESAKDAFSIQMNDSIQISGVIYGKELYITLAKQNISLIREFENILNTWVTENKNTKN